MIEPMLEYGIGMPMKVDNVGTKSICKTIVPEQSRQSDNNR
jgi:hypothetical protein